MQLNRLISNLPILIIWYWLFCFLFLTKTEFYIKYFNILDIVDTIIVVFLMLHICFYFEFYSKFKIAHLTGIFFIIFLNFIYEFLSESVYSFAYILIVTTTIILSIWNIHRPKK